MSTPLNLSQSQIIPLKYYLLIFGILMVVFHQYVYAIPANVQWIVFIGTMLLTGIPHGAIDHLVDEQTLINHNKRFSMVSFLTKYLSRMLLYALLWWFFPILAITIFIGISAYHFGETDLVSLSKQQKTEKLLFFSYGWMFLNLLFYTHKSEVIAILQTLPHFLDAFTNVLILLLGKYQVIYFSVCASCLVVSCFAYCKESGVGILPIAFVITQGVVLLFICAKLPFLLAFAFYFGLWHSLLCLQNIRQYLMQNNHLLAWNKLIKKAALFSFIAIFGIVIFILIGNEYNQTSDLLFWLFIGIAVLTAPHMEVMSDMFSSIKSKQQLATHPN